MKSRVPVMQIKSCSCSWLVWDDVAVAVSVAESGCETIFSLPWNFYILYSAVRQLQDCKTATASLIYFALPVCVLLLSPKACTD